MSLTLTRKFSISVLILCRNTPSKIQVFQQLKILLSYQPSNPLTIQKWNKRSVLRQCRDTDPVPVSLWRRANARNVRLCYPYWQYTDLFIFCTSNYPSVYPFVLSFFPSSLPFPSIPSLPSHPSLPASRPSLII